MLDNLYSYLFRYITGKAKHGKFWRNLLTKIIVWKYSIKKKERKKVVPIMKDNETHTSTKKFNFILKVSFF